MGKIRLSLTPWINHSWHVTLYLTARGLTTGPIPHGLRTFEIRFDFISHELRILVSTGELETHHLKPQSVAAFYRQIMDSMKKLRLPVEINLTANEIPETVRFDQDEEDRAYDRDYANRFWRVLVQSERVFTAFRSGFAENAARSISSGEASTWRSRDFRAPRASASGRRSASAQFGRPRSVLPGSEQSWILARKPEHAAGNLLFLCLPGASWDSRRRRFLRRKPLTIQRCTNSCSLTKLCVRRPILTT